MRLRNSWGIPLRVEAASSLGAGLRCFGNVTALCFPGPRDGPIDGVVPPSHVLSLCALVLLSALPRAVGEEPDPSSGRVITILAANLTSGNGQDYDPGHGNRIFQGLKPDIVLIQEMSYLSNTSEDLRRWIDSTFGPEFQSFREPGGGIPNGIISRFPILAAGEWDDTTLDNRDFAWARIDVPGTRDLWAISVHFKASRDEASHRNRQAQLLLRRLSSIPAQDYVVLGGDFNTHDRSERCLRTLSAYFVTSGPYPADPEGDADTNAGRDKPYDWVLADKDLHPWRVPLVLGSRRFPHGLVFDSRTYEPLAEVSPVQRDDSAAPNMQHMAVMRAFALPEAE